MNEESNYIYREMEEKNTKNSKQIECLIFNPDGSYFIKKLNNNEDNLFGKDKIIINDYKIKCNYYIYYNIFDKTNKYKKEYNYVGTYFMKMVDEIEYNNKKIYGSIIITKEKNNELLEIEKHDIEWLNDIYKMEIENENMFHDLIECSIL